MPQIKRSDAFLQATEAQFADNHALYEKRMNAIRNAMKREAQDGYVNASISHLNLTDEEFKVFD